MQPDIPFFILGLFIALVFALVVLILQQLNNGLIKTYGDKKRARAIIIKVAIFLFLWLAFTGILSQKNFLNNFSVLPPRMIIVVLPPLIAAIVLASSKAVSRILSNIPVHYLIYIQTFRVAMELILWMLYRCNIIPVQMTFEGSNYDILTGLSSLFVAFYYDRGVQFFRSKWFLILWNIAGLCLLANIVTIAILSAPFPFRTFPNEPSNTVIVYFPFIWLPGFVVPVAYTLHIFCIKKILQTKI